MFDAGKQHWAELFAITKQVKLDRPAPGPHLRVCALVCRPSPDPKAAPGYIPTARLLLRRHGAAKEPPSSFNVSQFPFGAAAQAGVGGASRDHANKFVALCCPGPINHEPPAALGERESSEVSRLFSVTYIYQREPRQGWHGACSLYG